VEEPLSRFARVGIIHPMLWPEVSGGEGPILETLERLVADTFFQAVEVTTMSDEETRLAARRLCEVGRVAVAFAAQPVLLRSRLSLNDPDDAARARAVEAVKGAIEKVVISEGQLDYQVIGNAKPRGICGSGLIDCIYELVKNGIIDPLGKFHRDRKDDRLRIEDNIPEYIIAYPEETESGAAVVITELDIDNLIKSKGAVFAAIKSLTDYIGLGFDMIETFYVAGGFGSYLDISKSIAIGLLPDISREKIRFIGNSSLTGARMALLSETAMETCINVSRSMTNVELSTYQPFTEEYIAALFLPHTNRKLFPSVTY